jgi:hypothetical protein
VAADHLDQLCGQVQPSRGVPWLPQAGQDRQADWPVGQHRQVHQHAHHDPIVGPGDAVAAGGQRVVVPGGPEDLAAGSAYERVVCDQPDRRAVGDQHDQDQVEQDQAELVGRPAGCGEEAVGAAVVPGPLQAGADEHATDGVQAGLGPEPVGQPAEGGEGGVVKQPRKRSSR